MSDPNVSYIAHFIDLVPVGKYDAVMATRYGLPPDSIEAMMLADAVFDLATAYLRLGNNGMGPLHPGISKVALHIALRKLTVPSVPDDVIGKLTAIYQRLPDQGPFPNIPQDTFAQEQGELVEIIRTIVREQ